jgi:hypothetical protein
VTVKIARRLLQVYEVGISYAGRTYAEGKKIGWKDGVRALWCLVKYGLKEPRTEQALVDSEKVQVDYANVGHEKPKSSRS